MKTKRFLAPVMMFMAVAMTAVPAMADPVVQGVLGASFDGEAVTGSDGDPKQWFVTSEAGESQSFWTQPIPGQLTGVSIELWGNPAENSLAATSDVLDIRMTLLPGPKGKVAANPEVQYLVNGFKDQWVATDDGAVTVTLDKVEMQDGSLNISGSFTAQANHTQDPTLMQIDRSKTKVIEGTFSALLPADMKR